MRKPKKPLSEWGNRFEQLLIEKQLSLVETTTILRAHKMFTRLSRTTLYRWMSCSEEKCSPRATLALTVIQDTPKLSVQTEMVRGWIEKLQSHDEQLRVMRKEVQDLIAQLTFHQS